MEQENQKVVEKHYIEVTASGRQKFLHGVLAGLGWGIGVTVGTALFLVLIGFIVSKIDFVPVLGKFLADVIKASETNLTSK